MKCRHQGPCCHPNHCSRGAGQETPSEAGGERVSVGSELALVMTQSEGSVVDSLLLLLLDGQLHKERGQGWETKSHQLPSLHCAALDGRETPPPDGPQYRANHTQPHYGAKLERSDYRRELFLCLMPHLDMFPKDMGV